MIIEYKCKFCNNPGKVEAPDDEAVMFQVKKWIPILCCNRCGDYMKKKRAQSDRIERACSILVQLKVSSGDKSRVDEAKEEIREALVSITRRFAAIVCEHYRKPLVWEPDFVSMLMEKPEQWTTALGMYVRGISKPTR